MPRSHVVAISLAVTTLAAWFGVHALMQPSADVGYVGPTPSAAVAVLLGFAVLFAAFITAVSIAHFADVVMPGIAKTLAVISSITLGLIGGLFATPVAGVAAGGYFVWRVASWAHERRTLNRLATEAQSAEELA